MVQMRNLYFYEAQYGKKRYKHKLSRRRRKKGKEERSSSNNNNNNTQDNNANQTKIKRVFF